MRIITTTLTGGDGGKRFIIIVGKR